MKTHLVFVLALALASASARGNSDQESGTFMPDGTHYLAADLLEPGILSGPDYVVLSSVDSVGYMLNFTLRTPYGDILAESREMLPIRIEEVAAIGRLQKTGLANAAGKKMKQRGTETWQSIKRVFTAPKETIKGLPDGVGRFVKNRARQIGRVLSHSKDKIVDSAKKNDQVDTPDGPMGATRAPPEQNKSEKNARLKKEGNRLLKQQTGFPATKRRIAQELGVDPYTTNPILVEKLDALAWSAVGSNKVFNLALGALSGATLSILPQVLKIDKAVWEMAPEDLERINQARLNNLNCTPGLVRRFVRTGAFTPTLETDFVVQMEKLAPNSGCDAALELALAAQNQQEARFVVHSMRLILAAPLPGIEFMAPGECELQSLGGGIAARCHQELLVPLPVDALTWDQDIAAYLDAGEVSQRAERTLLLSGFASEQSRLELTERGFAIIEKSPLQ